MSESAAPFGCTHFARPLENPMLSTAMELLPSEDVACKIRHHVIAEETEGRISTKQDEWSPKRTTAPGHQPYTLTLRPSELRRMLLEPTAGSNWKLLRGCGPDPLAEVV